MVIIVKCEVKEIFEKGEEYEWTRPERCPRCKGSHVWGHGFVSVYFEGLPGLAYIRRWRCPACWCVIRVSGRVDFFDAFRRRSRTFGPGCHFGYWEGIGCRGCPALARHTGCGPCTEGPRRTWATIGATIFFGPSITLCLDRLP